MIRRFYRGLPGPTPVRAVLMALVVVALLVVLGLAFEAAGDLIDTGGTIGP